MHIGNYMIILLSCSNYRHLTRYVASTVEIQRHQLYQQKTGRCFIFISFQSGVSLPTGSHIICQKHKISRNSINFTWPKHQRFNRKTFRLRICSMSSPDAYGLCAAAKATPQVTEITEIDGYSTCFNLSDPCAANFVYWKVHFIQMKQIDQLRMW